MKGDIYMKSSRLFFGLLFITLAVLLVLGSFFNISLTGELIVGIICFLIFLRGLSRLSFLATIIPLGVIAALIVDKLEIFSPGEHFGTIILCSILVGIGLEFIFGQFLKPLRHKRLLKKHGVTTDKSSTNDDFLNIYARRSNCTRYVNSKSFQGGEIDVEMCNAEIYLDNIELQDSSATIHVSSKLANIKLFVSKNIIVLYDNLTSNFADIDCFGNFPKPDNPKTIILDGKINLSGFEIHYV